MITGNISGKDINGTPSEEITMKFRKTGTTGKKIDIGRKTIIGALRKHNIIRMMEDNSNKTIEENTTETIEMTEIIETTETTSTTRTTNTASTRIDPGETKAVQVA